MAEPVSDRARVHPSFHHQRPMRMPEVMEADPRETETFEPWIPVAPPNAILMKRLALGPTEDESVLVERRAQPKSLLSLPSAKLAKAVYNWCRERDGTPRPLGLRLTEDHVTTGVFEGLVDREHRIVEIEIGLTDAEEFATPHPGSGTGQIERPHMEWGRCLRICEQYL